MNAPRAWIAARTGPITMAGLVLLFTIACGRWMIALHETGHAETNHDIASISQAIWNTSQGRLGRATILYEGVRDHLEPVLLVYALNYTVGGTVHTLLYLHALAIGLGALPFYAFGRQRGHSVMDAALMGTGYLLLPPLHRLIEKDYLRTDGLLFPVLALLAYAVTVRRDRLALAAAALALCVRESGALAVVGLGLHWLWVERRVPSGLALVAVGALWISLVTYVLLPWLLGRHLHAAEFRSPALIADQLAALWRERWPLGVLAATVLLLLRWRWAALPPCRPCLPCSSTGWSSATRPAVLDCVESIADEIAHWSSSRGRGAGSPAS